MVSAARVVSIPREGERVVGARVHDAETGLEHDVPARVVVNATGVWSGRVETLAGVDTPIRMRPSKGVHLIVPQERIDSSTALISRTRSSVLFVLPWGATWIIGTTDTPWRHGYSHPAPTQPDVAYLLAETNRVLSSDLAESDVTGAVRRAAPAARPRGHGRERAVPRARRAAPAARPRHGDRREVHDVPGDGRGRRSTRQRPTSARSPPPRPRRCPCSARPDPPRSLAATAGHRGATLVGDADRARLAARYGALLPEVLDLVVADPALAQPLGAAPGHLGVEVAYAAAYEGALHIDDVLTRRTRIYLEAGDRGLAAAGRVARLMAAVHGWDDATRAAEVVRYQRRLTAELQAQQAPDDDAAAATRDGARDPRLPAG